MSGSIPVFTSLVTTNLRALVRPTAPAVPCCRTVVIPWSGIAANALVAVDFSQTDEEEFVFNVQGVHVNNFNNTQRLALNVSDMGCNWTDYVAANATGIRYPPPISPFRMTLFISAVNTGSTILTFYNYPVFFSHYP